MASEVPWLWLGIGTASAFGAAFLAARLTGLYYTLRARAWTAPLSRRLSKWVKARPYDEETFYAADGATGSLVARRQAGLLNLAGALERRFASSIAFGKELREGFSDLRFTDANRVPFPFVKVIREKFDLSLAVSESNGPRLRDLDGNWSLDVSGSYGMNVFGFERYKQWIERGWEHVRALGPVLGPLHPLIAENIALLKRISGQDEVSFHASGTEAVMAAVRMARFNTGRKQIVCFSGAYHGWWDGVQPGLGSERPIEDCLTLKDLHPASLEVIRQRAHEIAAVLVNPVQSFHPNAPPPNDAVLLTSEVRKTESSSDSYGAWLRELRRVCREANVPLILDEVYSGFRLAPGGAQERFGVDADFVVYGKTVAGGMPIGVVCGKRDLMRRFDPELPMRIAYVVGTFSAHPLVMGAMNEFLTWITSGEADALYADADARCGAWAQETNRDLAHAKLPLRVVRSATIWTVLFTQPGRYNWLLQYYLRAEGLTLSWVGTGRCLVSLDFEPGDFDDLRHRLVRAADAMRRDGWWPAEADQPGLERRMRRALVRELVGSLVGVPRFAAKFYRDIMQRKHDDHIASHSHIVNQAGHVLSSSVFLFCYAWLPVDLTLSMCLGLSALFVRQFGHAVIEPPCHDKEELLLGFTTRSKSIVVAAFLGLPLLYALRNGTKPALNDVALGWFVLTLSVVMGHAALVAFQFGFRNSMIWLVKLVTDPITDLFAYTGPVSRACGRWLGFGVARSA
ncbi:MAG TPA: aminotransferase class III-fold pyridoxal phosphate-dependent enzyme [Myxococcota bacterium]|nr:aminotransferase class III-fold pyridoxal phosphate-dependent enzyme [Myxococcota bacterium]